MQPQLVLTVGVSAQTWHSETSLVLSMETVKGDSIADADAV